MTKVSKLYASFAANPRGPHSFRDFERLLLAFGFEAHRQRGSHKSFKHPSAQRMMVIQPRGSEAKGYQVEQFFDMIVEYGLTIDE